MLFDTSIIVNILRDRNYWENLKPKLEDSRITVSALTAYELYKGAYKQHAKHGRLNELEVVDRFVATCTIVPIDQKIARIAGSLFSKLEKEGVRASEADLIISATAICLNEKICTADEDYLEIARRSELKVYLPSV